MPSTKKNDEIDAELERMIPASGGRAPVPFFGFDTQNPGRRRNAFPRFPQAKDQAVGRSASADEIPTDTPTILPEMPI